MILVTGANGYVGGYVLKHLRETQPNAPVRALARNPRNADKLKAAGAQPVIGDVTDLPSLQAAMQGVDQVIHLAAVNRDKGASTMQAINAEGTKNVVAAAKEAGVKHIVNLVGLGADPRRPYPLASTQGEGVNAIIASGIPYTILETSVVFGAGDEFINTLAGLARIPPVMVVPGDGKTRFQPMAAQDVAACVVKSLALPAAINQRLQICGPEVVTLEQIIDAILAEMGVSRIKLHMPVPLLKIGVGLMEAVLPKPPVTSSLLGMLGVDNVATNNATFKVFGLLAMGLRRNIGFVKEMTLGKLIRRSLGKMEYR
ncbi:MAG TPA: NAD(P)H-binding protein [Thermoflexales bacterium]|nr:NAD(P)H-binding protein [Thermoflexales bacterium]HQW36835.1 NAD(P)H-binding protein [Thermoflexales bacterium]HQZ98603.1 NAD(P)H-binding protein [Thermoflexales bacterium]